MSTIASTAYGPAATQIPGLAPWPRATVTRLARVSPAARLTLDVVGVPCVPGPSASQVGPSGSVPVRLNTTAVVSAGTRFVGIDTARLVCAAIFVLSRLSKIRVGDTGVNIVPETEGVAACAGTTTVSAPVATATTSAANLAADTRTSTPGRRASMTVHVRHLR